MLTLHIGNIFTDIIGVLPPEPFLKLQRLMSFRPEGYEFTPTFNKWITDSHGKKVRRVWDGWKRQIWQNKKRTYFPTGLLSIARDFFNKEQILYELKDCRIKPVKNLFLDLAPGFVLRDYQGKVVDQCHLTQRGILQLATGAGKTPCSAALIQRLQVKPFIFFVTSIDLLLQAKSEFEKILYCNGNPIKTGQVGGGVVDIQDVNVATIQTVVRAIGETWEKYKFDTDDTDDLTPIEEKRANILTLLQTAQGVIGDETQHWRAETCQLVARSLQSAYYTYGTSATPFRDEGDDLMIQACFGKIIAQINASELIQKKWLIRPSIKIVHIRGEKTKFRQWQQIYKDQVSENDEYNRMVSNIANSYIQNDRLVLILVQHIKHGQKLASLVPGSVFLSGDSPKKQRENTLNLMREKKISCIISTSLFDEGIDVRPLDTLLLAGQGRSRVRAMQRIGRILRPFPGKTNATAIDFRIHQKYLLQHSLEREKLYRTEPEYQIEEIEI